jgi:DNA-binding transcriptional LysR family regulator
MYNFNFNLFKHFYYVVYYKGFTNASKKLNIAQSALSYNVKVLENQIEKILIIRNSKNFDLTEDGYNLYETLKSVFGILEQNVKQFSEEKIYEEVTIGIRHYLSDFIFKDAIKEFIEKYPNIHLNIKLYSKLDTKKFAEEYDLLIDYSDYTNLIETENKKKLCELSNIIVSGKELYKEYSNVTEISEINNAKFISLCPNKKKGKFQKFCFENNILFTDIISINDSLICKKMIKDNIGLCLVNEDSVKEEVATGDIKKISIKEKIFEDTIVIVYKNSNKAKELITILLHRN